MANLNKVFLMGNLTRDPELRYTPQGTAVVNLRLAVNRRFKDKNNNLKEETCFITVVVWDKQAESCNQFLRKG
ncbi:MAG: single-stranded DNA-binding protein, partial [Candidatus Omnitrophica bacterium]|nr:single-stranded DNA-binding protein [Candidatus Omnitrophota bacterium]